MKNKLHKKTGTSLIEFSLIILFIGIFIVATYQGYFVYLESKLVTAKSLTSNSIVGRLKNDIFWFETTFDESFLKDENADGKNISRWNNIKTSTENSLIFHAPQNNNPNNFNYEPNAFINCSGPKYMRYGINGLPTLNFSNSSNISQFLVTDFNNKITGTEDFYIYVVAEIIEFSKNATIIDSVCITPDKKITSDLALAENNCNPKLTMKVDILGNVHNLVSNNLNSTQIETSKFFSSKSKSHVFLLRRIYGNKFLFEVDGEKILDDKSENLGNINFLPIKIGRHATINDVNSNINISEFIVINGSISALQKKQIDKYLAKKYNISVK